MSTRPFRFIHTGDFHLEQPLMGVAEVPDHLRDLFLDAPYTAVRKVFDAALAEDADFVLLAGDVLRPQDTGPRGPLFLVEQFARLAEREIAVYWAGGVVDPPDGWPAALALPQNVHVFPQGRVEELSITVKGDSPIFADHGCAAVPAKIGTVPLARLLGMSRDAQRPVRPNDFSLDPAGLYTVAVVHGDADVNGLQGRAIHLWAMGGRHGRSTPLSGPHVIHYCGSPQGRCPEETGIHGCTLIQVDPQRQTRTSLIPTDAARWLDERLAVDETMTREDLASRLRERMHTIIETAAGTALLVSWTITGRGPVAQQLRRGSLAAELLQSLRNDYGYRSPAAWSVSLEAELSESYAPEWYEQETIRGDFLRAVRQLEMNPQEPLALDSYMAEAHLAGALTAAATVAGKPVHDRVLREAAALGVELLSGEEPPA